MGMPNKKLGKTSRPAQYHLWRKATNRTEKALLSTEKEVWSFFSGAMGFDLGLEAAGLRPTLAVEIDPMCCETIRKNRPELSLLADEDGDVSKLSATDLRK